LLKVARGEELASAMRGLYPQRDGGLVVLPTLLAFIHGREIAELALKQKLPAIGHFRVFAEGGGLMACGVNQDHQLRRVAPYVDRILKGSATGRSARPTTVAVPVRHQPQDRQSPRPNDPAGTAGAGGSGDRVVQRQAFIDVLAGGLLAALLAVEAIGWG